MGKDLQEMGLRLDIVVREFLGTYGYEECAGKLYATCVQGLEEPLIQAVMQHTKGNQTKAADLLGINRNTLRKKLSFYKIK